MEQSARQGVKLQKHFWILTREPYLKTLPVLIGLIAFNFLSCDLVQHTTEEPVNAHQTTVGFQTYLTIYDLLQNGDTIDYDTLMLVNNSINQSKHPISHIDQLLTCLINKRNDNPRIDQMILIFSAMAIGDSKFQIPNVYGIFESILQKDNRLNEWVISFVGFSIGKYPFDIPNGDILVDLLEGKLSQVTTMSISNPQESYGFHFLPPPKGDYIISYISGIQDQRSREIERASYYALVQSGLTEADIEIALKKIQKHGIPETGETCLLPMKHIRFNNGSRS